MRFILASASPRRKELLTQVGMKFEVQVSESEEHCDAVNPAEYVMELSRQKALDVAGKIPVMYDAPGVDQDFVVIGSDTVVSIHGQILGKPLDEEDAARMLRLLSGNIHQVFTGVTLVVFRSGRIEENTFFEMTDVKMYDMMEEDIKWYIRTTEPMDKAGAYAIQGLCAAYVAGINGEYASVVGLPVARLCQELKKMGIQWRED